MNRIHNAIERRNFLQFDLLTAEKIGLDKQDKLGLTPLMKCSHEPNKNNAREMVRLLLKQGANIKILDSLGMNVLQHAALAKNELVIDLLLQEGEYDPTFRDIRGNSALHVAAATGRMECVIPLVEHIKSYALKVDLRNDAGYTPLLVACCQGNIPVARYLFQQGSSLNSRDSEHGWTPDDWIREKLAVPVNISIFNPDSSVTYPTHEEAFIPEEPEEWYGARVYVFLKDSPELCLQEASEKVINKARMNKSRRVVASQALPAQSGRPKRLVSYRSKNKLIGNSDAQSKRKEINGDGTEQKFQRSDKRVVAPRKGDQSSSQHEVDNDETKRPESPSARTQKQQKNSAEKAEKPSPAPDIKKDKNKGAMDCPMPRLHHRRSVSSGMTSRRSAPELRQEYFRTQSNYFGCKCSDRIAVRTVRPFTAPAWKKKQSWRSPHDMKSVLTIDDMSNLRSAKNTDELKEGETDPEMRELLDNLIKKFHIKPASNEMGSMRFGRHQRRSSAPGTSLSADRLSSSFS